jgi:antitoxin MazE
LTKEIALVYTYVYTVLRNSVMTAKISKWGNSAAIRLPNDVLKFLSLHIGDSVELLQKENSLEIKIINNEKTAILNEAKRISKSARKEYDDLEGSLSDGL